MRNFLYLAISLLYSCAGNNNDKPEKNYEDSSNQSIRIDSGKTLTNDTVNIVMPTNITPLSFIKLLRRKENEMHKMGIITMPDNFPENWIRHSDIDSLMQFIYIKDRCGCYLNPLSSYIPYHEYAEVGGFAAEMIYSYKENKNVNFGLYFCPKVDDEIAGELVKWWTKEKEK